MIDGSPVGRNPCRIASAQRIGSRGLGCTIENSQYITENPSPCNGLFHLQTGPGLAKARESKPSTISYLKQCGAQNSAHMLCCLQQGLIGQRQLDDFVVYCQCHAKASILSSRRDLRARGAIHACVGVAILRQIETGGVPTVKMGSHQRRACSNLLCVSAC